MMHSLSISCLRQQHIIKRHIFFTASRTFSSISTQRRTDDSHHLQSSSTTNAINKQEDWREMFRSSDYDDAWSAYQPFINSPTSTSPHHQQQQQQENSINNIDITTTHQKQIIPSILNGSWKRRIFGMNLVPLCMTYNGIAVDEYDAQRRSMELEQQAITNNNTISNLQQNQQQQSSINTALNNPEVTKQLSKLQRIDIQTRFLCRMLDDLYQTGIWREIDRPRTERCHRAIGRLMTMTPENPPRRPTNNNANATNQQQQELGIGFTGLAQRAGAILHKLELCSPLALRNKQQVKHQSNKSMESTTTADTTDVDIEQTTSASEEGNDTSSSYQGVYNSYPQHLSHTKFALPTPTFKIYNMVLLSYGKEVSVREVPQQAEDVILGMLSRVVQQHRQHQSNSDSLLYPTVENWNCVLSCWSKSNDTDKAFYAFSFLLSWMEWNKHVELNNDELYSSLKSSSADDGVDGISKPSMDSFYFVLQSCLVNEEIDIVKDGDDNDSSTEDESKDIRIQRAKEMGAGVAIRLWNEMQRGSNNDTSLDIDSTMYHEILQAICQSSELPSTKSTTSRPLAALARVFTSCCKDGMNTIEIMNLVRDHTTESQFDQLKAKVATFL